MVKPQEKPAIASLSPEEFQLLLQQVQEGESLSDSWKKIVVETMQRFNEILEQLKSSKISMSQIQKLLGFYSEQLKKHRQDR
jgi:hypothetical protein